MSHKPCYKLLCSILLAIAFTPAIVLSAPPEQANGKQKTSPISLTDIAKFYKKLPSPKRMRVADDDKIEVIEFFWYGCPHCYHLEPVIEKWLEEKAVYIDFIRVPGILGGNWLPHARAFYVAKKLGVLDAIHRPLFDAIHKDRKKILDQKTLKKFFSAQGISSEDFERVYKSAEIEDKVRKAYTLGKHHKLTGVPVIVINGEYITSPSLANTYDNLIKTINTLALTEYQKLKQ